MHRYCRFLPFLSISLLFILSPVVSANEKVERFDALLSNYSYSQQVEKFEFESQGLSLQMSYMYLNAKKGNPTVMLLHGKNFVADYWSETAEFLANEGYAVLMPDQVGFGKSSKPRHYQFSFSALSRNTAALLDALGLDDVIVVGHSMGGMLASRFALAYPERTSGLVLVNPIGLENYTNLTEYKDVRFFYEMELHKTKEKIIEYQRKNYYAGQWNERYASLTDFMVGQINGPDKRLIAWVNALTYDMIFTQPVVTEFSQLNTKTVLIIGTRDRTAPGKNWKREGVEAEMGRFDTLGKSAVQTLPNAKLIEIDGVGHLPHIESFNLFSEHILSAFHYLESNDVR